MKRKNPRKRRPVAIERVEGRFLLSGYALSTLDSFDGTAGVAPQAGVTFDSKGDLFGTTASGGNFGHGAVFEISAGSTTPFNIASFTGFNQNGATPLAGVTFDAKGNLFGTTFRGGDANGDGTVYEIAAGTGMFSTVADFSGANGAHPHASVVFDSSGNMFGTTSGGGDSNGDGTVFEIAAGTKTITTVAAFNGSNGSQPFGALILDSSGNMYGTTNGGGSSGEGTVFEISKGSHSIVTLASFSGLGGPGPMAGVTMDASGNLFGTTVAGGASQRGEVFEIVHGSKTITPLASFNVTNGADPVDAVTLDSSGDVFGTTVDGTGTSADGTIFEVVKGTNTVKTLASFNGINGSFSEAPLTFDKNGNLFGAASAGGISGNGTVFELPKGATTLKAVASFRTNGGTQPSGNIAIDAKGDVFGTTTYGGTSGDGSVFEIKSGSSTITTIASFKGNNGTQPSGGVLLDSHGNLFGTTDLGGTNNDGTVFEIKSGTSTIATVANFNDQNGRIPACPLISDSSGNLFGMTVAGGVGEFGTVFEIKAGTTAIVTLATLNSAVSLPVGGLALDSSGNLFGAAQFTSGGFGGVYEVKKGSSVATLVANFTGVNQGGQTPDAGVTFDSSGNLFGTTAYGGTAGDGILFEIKKGTSTAITITNFTGNNGSRPEGEVIFDSQGNLFGTTDAGNSSGGTFGDVYELPKGSSSLRIIANFTGANHGGASPGNLAFDANGNLLGCTSTGGIDQAGAVFKLTPTITVTAPAAQTATPGIAKTFSLGSFIETGILGSFTVDVHWNDGTADTIFSQSTPGSIPGKPHTFAKAGTYTITLTVKDSHGHSGSGSFKVTV